MADLVGRDMTFLLSLLTSRLSGPIASIVAVILLALCVGQCTGRIKAEHRADKAEKLIAKAEDAARKREKAAEAITAEIKPKLAEERVKIVYRTKTLIREVPTYVTAQDDARCVVNAGFVRLHDAAASGSSSLPAPASGSDQAPTDVQLSTVLTTVVGNYGVAYDWRAEALTWRDWYAQQKAAWER